MYGAAAAEQAERALVSETLPGAIEQAGLVPVSEPDVDAAPPRAGEPFSYSARIEVKPEIEVPDLAGLEAKRPRVEVTEGQVDEQIERIRENMAPLVEVAEEAAAEPGHTLNIDFVGRVDGEVFEGGTGEDLVVELGSGRLVPGFEEQLAGMKAGEQAEVRVTFPEDYGEVSLAGKDAVFDVTVRSIRAKQVPEVDDEFAKDVGEDSLEALRAKIREQLESQAKSRARAELRRTLVDSLIERSDFEVPPGLVDRQLHAQMRRMQQQFQGQVPDEVLRGELARMHESGRESAERSVREALLLDAVVREHGIEVSDEDLRARLEEIASAQGNDVETLQRMAEDQGWLRQIEAEVLDERALDFLEARASVEETTDT